MLVGLGSSILKVMFLFGLFVHQLDRPLFH